MRIATLIIPAAIAAIAVPASAQGRNWQTIGERSIEYGIDRDKIELRGDRRDITNVKLFYSRFNRGRAPLIRIQAR